MCKFVQSVDTHMLNYNLKLKQDKLKQNRLTKEIESIKAKISEISQHSNTLSCKKKITFIIKYPIEEEKEPDYSKVLEKFQTEIHQIITGLTLKNINFQNTLNADGFDSSPNPN